MGGDSQSPPHSRNQSNELYFVSPRSHMSLTRPTRDTIQLPSKSSFRETSPTRLSLLAPKIDSSFVLSPLQKDLTTPKLILGNKAKRDQYPFSFQT